MRLKSIILTELIHDRLVAYEELERAMNKKAPIDKTKDKIRGYLREISILNGMITEWQSMTENDAANNLSRNLQNTDGARKEMEK